MSICFPNQWCFQPFLFIQEHKVRLPILAEKRNRFGINWSGISRLSYKHDSHFSRFSRAASAGGAASPSPAEYSGTVRIIIVIILFYF